MCLSSAGLSTRFRTWGKADSADVVVLIPLEIFGPLELEVLVVAERPERFDQPVGRAFAKDPIIPQAEIGLERLDRIEGLAAVDPVDVGDVVAKALEHPLEKEDRGAAIAATDTTLTPRRKAAGRNARSAAIVSSGGWPIATA